MDKETIINALLKFSENIRYVAIYSDGDLSYAQRDDLSASSSEETDKFEELLVNPTLLKLATQRGNIDCGGLDYLLIRYGNFFQLVRPLLDGHISICLDKMVELNSLPDKIFSFLKENQVPL